MKPFTLLLIVIAIIWLTMNYIPVEDFTDLNFIEFTRLDGSLIKRVKVGSSYGLYGAEVLYLFRQDQTIRINIPVNFSVNLIYKFTNSAKGFAKTVYLEAGSYDIQKSYSDIIIDQIEMKQVYGFNDNEYYVKNIYGNIIYRAPIYIPIDWDDIYYNYGYNDYIVYYPRKRPILNNYPRYYYNTYHNNIFRRGYTAESNYMPSYRPNPKQVVNSHQNPRPPVNQDTTVYKGGFSYAKRR